MAVSDLVFKSARELAALIQSKEVSPVDVTTAFLDRAEALNPRINAFITITRDVALARAREAEREIASGRYRGPLHGIPWGAKDLLDTQDIRTTWGIRHHEGRVPQADASVVRKLREAGAVLVAKLSMGELASGARWYGGTTRCPWDVSRSSSGSSAGPGAATAAGSGARSGSEESSGLPGSPRW